ncbi:hypothetical protein I4U23_020878 [Adineta vaga]|nr:hypothetical protein I4U23_020878 [Adineta vaga]
MIYSDSTYVRQKSIMDEHITENKESITLIWFDPALGLREDTERTKEQLRRINDYVIFHTEISECVAYIQSISEEKIFLITSGAHASELLIRVHELSQIDSIFIFCIKKTKYKDLLNKYSKVIDIFVDRKSLCISILEQINLVNKQLETFSFFDQHQRAIKDLSKQSGEFLWYQLFKDLIVRLPGNLQAKQEMIDTCRHYYRGNSNEQKLIDEFEQDYQPEHAIKWYSKQSFVYKLVNKALRSEDIDQLHTLRIFVSDLSKSLEREHQNMLHSEEKILTVFRGAKLTMEDFDKIMQNEGKLISINGFLSASRSRSRASSFAKKPTRRVDVVAVLFAIQCNIQELDQSVIFADIAKFSEYPQEEEVLFNLSATFHIDSIQQEETLWLINMSASNESQSIIKQYLDLQREEVKEKSVVILIGRLMCSSGQYDKSLRYFQKLLADPNGEDLAWIEFNIGRAFIWKCDWFNARKWYDSVYDRMVNAKPSRLKDSATVLRSIGVILYRQGKHNEALDYYQRSLTIQEKFYPNGHLGIAWTLNCIGSICRAQEKYAEALEYYQRAFTMQEKFLPPDHADIAWNLNNIARVFQKQEKYDEALNLHRQALEIQEKYYPSDHAFIAWSLNHIGAILRMQGNIKEAFDLHQRALRIQEKTYVTEHLDIAHSLHKIGLVYFDQYEYDRALDYFERSLKMKEQFLSHNHIKIAHNLANIGATYKKLSQSKMALKYYEHALAIYEQIVSQEHLDRQKTEQWIQRLRSND